jgi:hypothetical protein
VELSVLKDKHPNDGYLTTLLPHLNQDTGSMLRTNFPSIKCKLRTLRKSASNSEEDRKDSITGNTGNLAYDVSNESLDSLISNFVRGVDKIMVNHLTIDGSLTVGNLPESEFVSGAGVVAATNSTQRYLRHYFKQSAVRS